MKTVIIVGFNPLDKEQLQAYGSQVPATLAPFNGVMLAKGPAQPLNGVDSGFAMQAIIQFDSKKSALGWYQSAQYQALIPQRDKGMNASFQLCSADE